MKKMMYFAAALLVLVGCNKNSQTNKENAPQEVVTIKGSIVLPQTPNKIAPAEEWQSVNTPFDMLWEEGDQIYIYNQEDPDNGQVFTLIEGVGTTEGTFSGTKLEDMSNYYVANVGQTGVGEYTVEYIEDNFSDPYIFGTGNKDGFIIDNFGAVLGLPLKGEVTLSKIEVKTFEGKNQPLSTFTMSFAEGLELNNTAATMVYFPVDASELITIETINLYVGDELLMSKTLSAEKGNLPGYSKVTTFPELVIPTYVDLGLPSGTKWATFNVGATTPEGYGDYFAWAETAPYYNTPVTNPMTWKTGKEGGYAWSSYKGYSGEFSGFEPEWDPAPYDASSKVLKPEYDAATANWGDAWRMPTKEDFEELLANCNYEIIENYNNTGIKGCVFTNKSNSSMSIFLPAAGDYYALNLVWSNSKIYYWTSSYDEEDHRAYDFEIAEQGGNCSRSNHYVGHPIRPIHVE